MAVTAIHGPAKAHGLLIFFKVCTEPCAPVMSAIHECAAFYFDRQHLIGPAKVKAPIPHPGLLYPLANPLARSACRHGRESVFPFGLRQIAGAYVEGQLIF